MTDPPLANPAPWPACGSYADGFAPVARVFAEHLARGEEVGAGVSATHRGARVVDLWGGVADVASGRAWEADTRAVVFSVTKGLVAMALNLLADRGKLAWDAPVAEVWPDFAASGKARVTPELLFGHRAGLPGLDRAFSVDDCLSPSTYAEVRRSLTRQAPLWEPGEHQGYHAATFGLYATEVFERAAGERLGAFLSRELLEPLGADVSLGTPASVDARVATLYPPTARERVLHMARAISRDPGCTEARVARAIATPRSMVRRSFLNPSTGPRGLSVFDDLPARRAELAWVGATASARGLARAYAPFACGGEVDGVRVLSPAALSALYPRRGWSERDLVLQKPLGWSRGFLKEELGLFSPHAESFGHAGIGGALGWCDPVTQVSFGYVMNKLDWRVRSPRAIALARALAACEPVRAAG
ncbi:MAG: beta-lactamase family protein [Polyangiaceae bacterium]|nr:beta-lactamase family protein [Polyangiaceae bacterium]